MRAIVYRGSDHTRVYGYVYVDVLSSDGLIDERAHDRLPDAWLAIQEEQ